MFPGQCRCLGTKCEDITAQCPKQLQESKSWSLNVLSDPVQFVAWYLLYAEIALFFIVLIYVVSIALPYNVYYKTGYNILQQFV